LYKTGGRVICKETSPQVLRTGKPLCMVSKCGRWDRVLAIGLDGNLIGAKES
jgi:hypothetical protein